MSGASTKIFEFESPPLDPTKDGLFIERLDAFLQKSLGEIKAFAERELRPYEETRRRIAEWHARYLFESQPSGRSGKNPLQVTLILRDASRVLESLSNISGVQSFILAVNPDNPADNGFLGGSVIGREFWRGLRGGGEAGAKAFKTQSAAHLQNKETPPGASHSRSVERRVSTPPAKSIKSELYETVRNALRLASGVRGAEMKWTNPERLDAYGVRLVGWPEGIPYQNPSTLKVNQNKILLEAIQRKSMKFVKIATEHLSEKTSQDVNTVDEDFSWAYDADALPASPPPPPTSSSSSTFARGSTSTAFIDTPNSWTLASTVLSHTGIIAEANSTEPMTEAADYLWQNDLGEEVLDLGVDWRGDPDVMLERPKKRHRCDDLQVDSEDHR